MDEYFQQLIELFKQHNQESNRHYGQILEAISSLKGEWHVPQNTENYSRQGGAAHMEGINSDKVNIHLGGDGGGAGNMAAVIAALGNRNQGNDNAALIAALGNRNDDSNSLAPLLAMMNNRRNDDGINALWPILFLALAGRGRGGLFGGDDGNCNPAANIVELQALNAIQAAIPSTALELQNAVQQALGSLALGVQQGFANTKDSVQASTFVLSDRINDTNQNVSSQGCQTREAVQNDGDKTRALLVARFQQEDATTIAEQNARIVALETRGHIDRQHAENTLQITNTNTAVATSVQRQEQDQRQAQLQFLIGELRELRCEVAHTKQIAQATNQNIIAGNTGAVTTGAQAANPTNVNT